VAVDPPNLGEVLRGLEALRQDVAALIAEMKADRAENARIYVRSDVYLERSKVHDQNVADIHRDIGSLDKKIDAEAVKTQAAVDKAKAEAQAKFTVLETERKTDIAWRRQMLLAVGLCAVTTVVTIVLFVLNYVSR
jgi:uncharacterized membrane protein